MSSQQRPLVFITGASSGIGQALALRFAQAGYRLALVARRGAELEAWAASRHGGPFEHMLGKPLRIETVQPARPAARGRRRTLSGRVRERQTPQPIVVPLEPAKKKRGGVTPRIALVAEEKRPARRRR